MVKRSDIKRKRLRKNSCCYYCKVSLTLKTATLDHKIPKCHGGTNHSSNLVLACEYCNNKKGCLTEKEFNARRKMQNTLKDVCVQQIQLLMDLAKIKTIILSDKSDMNKITKI